MNGVLGTQLYFHHLDWLKSSKYFNFYGNKNLYLLTNIGNIKRFIVTFIFICTTIKVHSFNIRENIIIHESIRYKNIYSNRFLNYNFKI